MKKYNRLHELARFMKKGLPLSHPVRIRRVKMPKGYEGDCSLRKDYFLIRIDKNLAEDYAIETLIHEFAHAVAWDKDSDFHGPNWGKAYSVVYRKSLEFFHNA